MENAADIYEAIRRLSPDEIRSRLEEISREAKVLRTLLRSSLIAKRRSGFNQVDGTREVSS